MKRLPIIFKKTKRAIHGLWLLKKCLKTFQPDTHFKGKRIAIVGPAGSAYNTGKGSYIDTFDYVIRINKAPHFLKEGKSREDIGSKTDILFHSFFENDHSGGGTLDLDLYDRLGIKYIINPIPTYFGLRVIFNFYKKYLLSRTVYTLPTKPYKKLEGRLKPFQPTTGFCALNAALQSDFAELFITGFTFFKTSYIDGYRDQMKESEKARKYISEMRLHNPDLEFSEFKRLLNKNIHKTILLDETLQGIIRVEIDPWA